MRVSTRQRRMRRAKVRRMRAIKADSTRSASARQKSLHKFVGLDSLSYIETDIPEGMTATEYRFRATPAECGWCGHPASAVNPAPCERCGMEQ